MPENPSKGLRSNFSPGKSDDAVFGKGSYKASAGDEPPRRQSAFQGVPFGSLAHSARHGMWTYGIANPWEDVIKRSTRPIWS